MDQLDKLHLKALLFVGPKEVLEILKVGQTSVFPCQHDLTQILTPFWLGSKIRNASESPVLKDG